MLERLFKFFQKTSAPEAPTAKLPLAEGKFAELVTFVEQRELAARLPELSSGLAIEIAPRQKTHAALLRSKGIGKVIGIGSRRDQKISAEGTDLYLLSPWDRLPLLDGCAEAVICRSAFLHSGLTRTLREVARVLKRGGVAVISDLHPFSEMVQEAHLKRAVGEEALAPGFERYFRAFQEGTMRLASVREVFFDGSIRKFFASERELSALDQLRRRPLLLILVAVKEG